MRFRTGLLVGLAVGYYYGTRAGRERYEQIEQWLDRIRSTTTFQEARTKLSDGLRGGTTAARRVFEEATSGATESPATRREPDSQPSGQALGDPTFN
jgi:hypothetical protein